MRASKQIIDEITAKRAEAKGLLEKSDLAAEDIAAAETLRDEIAALEVEAKQAEEIERFRAQNDAALKAPPTGPVPFARAATPLTSPVYGGKSRVFRGEDGAERAYKFGKWFLGMLGNEQAKAFCGEHGIEIKTHNEGTNTAGGYLVPHQFEADLIDLREMYGVFRANAKIVPMSSDTRSDPRRTGGLTAYWGAESEAMTASDKSWDRVNLTAKKMYVYSKVTAELSEDAVVSMADDLASEIAYAFATKEDAAGFTGDGTSTYGGIVGVTNALLNLSATRANIAGLQVASGNLFSEIVLGDFNGVKARLPEYADKRGAKWYASKAFFHGVMEKLAVAAGGVTEGGIAGGIAGKRFLGDPVEITQTLPRTDANDQVVCLYGHLPSAARLGDRRQTTIAVSEHVAFSTDEIAIRGTQRLDIVVHDVGNASGTASLRVAGPIVGLLMAAS